MRNSRFYLVDELKLHVDLVFYASPVVLLTRLSVMCKCENLNFLKILRVVFVCVEQLVWFCFLNWGFPKLCANFKLCIVCLVASYPIWVWLNVAIWMELLITDNT
jgi:hypothetical protein